MKDEEFDLFQDFLEKKSGLHFDYSKLESLKVSLLERMQSQNLLNFVDYYRFLADHPEGKKELRALLSLITVNETSFFRQPEQFEVLRKEILPELISEKGKRGDLTLSIWSAGCSSGEEPYSIALLLREVFPEVLSWNLEILGTDIDEEALSEAEQGIYSRRHVRYIDQETMGKYRGLLPKLLKYFDKKDKKYRLEDEIKKMVNFVYHNLAEERYLSPQSASGAHHNWDIIFCRNVLIYFKPEKIEKIFDHFYRHLNEPGYLFLGYAESIGRFSNFSVVHTGDTFYYKKETTIPGSLLTSPEVTTFRGAIPSETLPIILKKPTERIPSPEVVSQRVFSPKKVTPSREVITSREDRFEKLYQEIVKFFDRGEFKLALEKINELFSTNKILPQLYYLSGIIQDRLNASEKAIVEFKRVIYLDNNFPMAHFHLAEIYLRTGKKKDALREYKNVLRALENGNIEEPIPFSGGFSKKALAETCERNIDRLR